MTTLFETKYNVIYVTYDNAYIFPEDIAHIHCTYFMLVRYDKQL